MKKNRKAKIIIPIAALLLAAAIVIPVYMLKIKNPSPSGQEDITNGGGSDTKISVDVDYGEPEATYETAEYNGYTLPKVIADCFLQADADTAAACEKYGVAFETGGRKVSTPEYTMAYYDIYNSIILNGTADENNLMVNSASLPSQQPYGDFGYNWDTQLRKLTDDSLTEKFLMFDEALNNGFTVTDDLVDSFNSTYTTIEQSVLTGGFSSIEELCEKAYTKGVTIDMYMRQFTLYMVTEQYKADIAEKAMSDLSDAEAEKIYSANKSDYDYVDAIIITVNPEHGDFVNSNLSKIKDPDSFYQCCIDYYSEHNYPMDLTYARQLCNWGHSNYGGLERRLGKNIADWCYDPSRKAGDVGAVEGEMYICIIYLETAPYDSYSVDIHEMAFYYDEETLTTQPTDEQKEAVKEALLEAKKAFTATDQTLDDFIAVTKQYGQGANAANGGALPGQRLPDLDYDTGYWCFADKPKEGEWAVLYTPRGCSIFFFDKANTEDKDSLFYVRNEIADKKYSDYLDSVKGFNGNETVSYGAEAEKAIEIVEKKIQASIDERNKAVNEALGQKNQ